MPVRDHYPYENLTPKEVADVQRARDRVMRNLREENDQLKDRLYWLGRALVKAGMDPDTLIETEKAFLR